MQHALPRLGYYYYVSVLVKLLGKGNWSGVCWEALFESMHIPSAAGRKWIPRSRYIVIDDQSPKKPSPSGSEQAKMIMRGSQPSA